MITPKGSMESEPQLHLGCINDGPQLRSVPSVDGLDKTGIGVSLACAVHCVGGAAFSFVPALAAHSAIGGWLEALEIPFLISALIIGTTSLFPSIKHHGNKWPLALFLCGVTSIGCGFFFDVIEMPLTVFGVTLVATAHVINLKSMRKCGHHEHQRAPHAH